MVRPLTGAADDARCREVLRRALLLHQSQRYALADPAYRGALALVPAHADALHLYGLVRLQAGAAAAAARLIGRAIRLNPGSAEYQANLGHASALAAQHRAAAAAFRAALGHEPERADWRCALGTALLALGDQETGARELRRGLLLDPGQAQAEFLLAGLADAAIGARHLRRALALASDFAPAEYNLGSRLLELGSGEAAGLRFRRAVTLDPALVQAFNNLGESAKAGGRLAEAIALYRRAVALAPMEGDFWLNLGSGLQLDQRLDGARAAYRRTLALRPHAAEALSNAGTVAQEQGELDRAALLLQRALAIRPTDAVVWNNLGNALTEIGAVVAAYRHAIAFDPNYREAHSNLLFALNYQPGIDCEALFLEYRRWADRHARPAYARIRGHGNSRDPERPLRIGYLSADLRSNPIAYNLIGLLERRDRAGFQAYCYAEVARPDAMTERWRRSADGFRFTVGLGDEAVADRIRSDAIDILVCLGGHTANNRVLICAHKPAPVQMSYGDLSTTGLETMDYWLTDANVHPPDTKERFAERLLHLPLLVSHEPPADSPEVGELPALAAGRVTFGSFNNLAKLNDAVLALWSAALKAVPSSQLILKYVNWFENPSVRQRVAASFAKHGLEREKLIFVDERLPRGRHLQLLNRVDIALDPFPFNGCTTSFEALWMGVPVVTLKG
ncbi:MAG: tetratricopeptide repeat protein, partial [Proteobacteria bacterium]|nr:tetratricopeptide repeat protein [Pseudomonadota bacterium]